MIVNVEALASGLIGLRRIRLIALSILSLAFLVLASWLQWPFWFTQCPGQIGADCEGQWTDLQWTFTVETILCVGFVTLGTLIAGRASRFGQNGAASSEKCATPAMIFACAVALLAPLLTVWFVLDRFPNSGDEFSYLFQARTFAKFRLWEVPPALGAELIPHRTWIFGDKWISQYPPGWALALSAGSLLGLPMWTMNAVLGVASVAVLAVFCRRIADRSAAAVAAVLYALTPFYVMNAASYFPHVFSSLLILCLCLCLRSDDAEPRPLRLVASGAVLGALAATRYFDVVPLIPALLMWLLAAERATWPRKVGLMALGFAPFAVLLAAYQSAVLGNPLASTYAVINTRDTFLSLDPLLLAIGPLTIAVRLAELALWTYPLLLIAYFVALAFKWRSRTLAFYDLIFPGFVIAYVAFANFGGNRYGPRYYLDAFPLMFATTISAMPTMSTALSRPIAQTLARLAIVAFPLYLASVWPLVLSAFSQQVWRREEPFRLAAQAGLANAVVIQDTTSAAGLLSSDLVRNPPSMDAPVLYARSDVNVDALRKAFPKRSIWRYARPDPAMESQLLRVAP